MSIEYLQSMPLPAFMLADYFWPGLALVLVNGVPNIEALVVRFCGNLQASYSWGMIAGVPLIAWTVFEMIFIPGFRSSTWCSVLCSWPQAGKPLASADARKTLDHAVFSW